MSKIKIKCDICGEDYSPSEVYQAEFSKQYDTAMWLREPEIDGEHFICINCIVKLGWSDEKGTETTSNEGEDKHE